MRDQNIKVWMSTEISPTQHANFIEVANHLGISAKALLRKMIANAGEKAELIRQGDKEDGDTIRTYESYHS